MKPKKAIVVLTRGYTELEKYSTLVKRNHKIEENLKEDMDILIFHEGNIPLDHQQNIQSHTELSLSFVETPFKKPEGEITFKPGTERFGWGYRHMCSFWFTSFWDHVKDYDVILRIDEDCLMSSAIDPVFDLLESKVCVYGRWSKDKHYVTEGMNSFSLKEMELEAAERRPSGPYTNVIGFNLTRLRENRKLFKYIKAVERSNNIFIYRWGDLPLWGEALHYLYGPFKESNDHVFTDLIQYYHGSHRKRVNMSKSDQRRL